MEGWFFIMEYQGRCCLWNPVTRESIRLPSLGLKPKQNIYSCILSSPPGDPNSTILIFFLSDPSVMFCRVRDRQWTEQSLTGGGIRSLCSPVCCNTKLYAIAFIDHRVELVGIDLNYGEGHLAFHLHGTLPSPKDCSSCIRSFLVESCGEIFVIYLVHGGKEYLEVTGIEVFKFDFLLMEWREVESIRDRVFFVDERAAYSYRAVKPETEGNRIYFTLNDRSLYSFHVQDNTVSVSLPFPDLKSPWTSPVWVMPSCSYRLCPAVDGETKHEIDGVNLDINSEQIKDIVPYAECHDENAQETARLCELPLDMLSSIARGLTFHDYISFRLLDRTCRSVAPSVRIKELARNSELPWLIFCKKGQDECKLIDPLRQECYLMNNPNKSNEVRMCYSKQGWCLMLQGDDTVYLWNPFTKKTIPLPESPHGPRPCRAIIGCEFLSSPDSSNCILVLVCDLVAYTSFDYINIELGTWESEVMFDWTDLKVTQNNNPVLCNGDLCFLDLKGTLMVFTPDDSVWGVQSPFHSSHHQSFLIEANGKLLAVFLGFMGKWLKVFEFDFSNDTIWVEVDNVGDKTLYISRISSFAATATREEMKNVVFVPRFYEDKLVYYCLSSRKWHCYGSNVVLGDLYNTKEQLYSGWFVPS
ncbi:hypothetical protein V6N11_038771 [Hibiscus sabdariffa]|uniref:KIB1-4 beta-propeller domain-containing protein n=1 Tax=Hibiscus sabdariffa TaxID=183260 RepID=A0ABR2SKY8_9ROSI